MKMCQNRCKFLTNFFMPYIILRDHHTQLERNMHKVLHMPSVLKQVFTTWCTGGTSSLRLNFELQFKFEALHLKAKHTI